MSAMIDKFKAMQVSPPPEILSYYNNLNTQFSVGGV